MRALMYTVWCTFKPIAYIWVAVCTLALALKMAGCDQPGPHSVMNNRGPAQGLSAPMNGSEVLYRTR